MGSMQAARIFLTGRDGYSVSVRAKKMAEALYAPQLWFCDIC